MRSRYKNLFDREKAPFFGTFHGLFYKLLLREGYNIQIINGTSSYKIIMSVLAKYSDDVSEDKIKEVLNNISIFKTSLKKIEEFSPTMPKDIFEECLKEYEEFKSTNGLWDFDDLSIKIINLFKENKDILYRYRKLFKYVLVDEFQDCDELQMEFLKLIIGEDNSIFAVGDEDQCIYSFRGSKPEYMVTFDKIFREAKKVYLSINYRSSKNIVEASKKIISNNKSRNKKIIEAFKKDDGLIRFLTPFDESIQGEEISKVLEKTNGSLADNAILYRTNMEAMSLINTFIRRNIPFVLLDKGYNFYDHFICKDIISYLRLAININDRESFLSIINKPFRYISKTNLDYIRKSYEDKSAFDLLIEKIDMAPYQCKKLEELKNEILYLNKISLGTAIQYIISDLKYIDYLKEYAERYNQNIEEFEVILEEFKSLANAFKTIVEFLTHIERVREELEISKEVKEGVILSTIHGVKGMEFKNVFIINAVEETIPHKSSIENNLEEERRLFYVGVTRAIENLYIYSPKKQQGRFREVSRFVAEGEFREIESREYYGLKVGITVHHKNYGEGYISEIKGDAVKIVFEDKESRTFSIMVLMENNILSMIN